MGYMSGAVESGLRAANEVLFAMDMKHLVSRKHLVGIVEQSQIILMFRMAVSTKMAMSHPVCL